MEIPLVGPFSDFIDCSVLWRGDCACGEQRWWCDVKWMKTKRREIWGWPENSNCHRITTIRQLEWITTMNWLSSLWADLQEKNRDQPPLIVFGGGRGELKGIGPWLVSLVFYWNYEPQKVRNSFVIFLSCVRVYVAYLFHRMFDSRSNLGTRTIGQMIQMTQAPQSLPSSCDIFTQPENPLKNSIL